MNNLGLLRSRTLPSLLGLVCFVSATFAGDWPQVLGPGRNSTSIDETLANNWLLVKPTKLWEVEVGEGYAGPAVKDNRVCVFHRVDETNN